MNVLIIEDEKIAAEKLENMLNLIDPSIVVMNKIGSIKESIKWLFHNQADLIFLDIQLSDGISFSIFEQISVNTPIIFTTAYDKYAIKAFQVNSISYLLKPIREIDLSAALAKYKTLKKAQTIDFDTIVSQIQGKPFQYKKRFIIQIGEKIKKVETKDIAYFYIFGKSVYLKSFTGAALPLDFSLDKLEELLSPSVFFRINRKYIVNMDAISQMTAYSRARVKLELVPNVDDITETIVSIDRSSEFKKWLNK